MKLLAELQQAGKTGDEKEPGDWATRYKGLGGQVEKRRREDVAHGTSNETVLPEGRGNKQFRQEEEPGEHRVCSTRGHGLDQDTHSAFSSATRYQSSFRVAIITAPRARKSSPAPSSRALSSLASSPYNAA